MRLNAAVISPMPIFQFGTDRMFFPGERRRENNRQVFVLGNLRQILRLGGDVLPVIENLMSGTELGALDAVIVFPRLEFRSIVEPLAMAVPKEKLLWALCPHTASIQGDIFRAGHLSPRIIMREGCNDEKDSGYLVWNILNRGQFELKKPFALNTRSMAAQGSGRRITSL